MSYLCYLCLFAYSGVKHFVLFNVFKVLVPCCDGRYDFPHKTMFGSSLYFVCRRARVLFLLFMFICA